MNPYALVETCTTEFEAKLAESILRAAGIATFLQSPDGYPPLDFRRGIKVMVKPEEAERAKALLTEFESDRSKQQVG